LAAEDVGADAHDVEAVGVFEVAAVSGGIDAGRFPSVGVEDAGVVADFVGGDSGVELAVEPDVATADGGASAPAGENGLEGEDEEIVVVGVELVGGTVLAIEIASGGDGVVAELEVAGASIPIGGL